jgi:hypothetical protein
LAKAQDRDAVPAPQTGTEAHADAPDDALKTELADAAAALNQPLTPSPALIDKDPVQLDLRFMLDYALACNDPT